MRCDKPGALPVSAIQQELLVKAFNLKSIAAASSIDLRIFSVSSCDNFPTERLNFLATELKSKIKEYKDTNNHSEGLKAEKEKIALNWYEYGTHITWGTGQLDVVKWIVTGVAPAGSSLLTDFNQSNPLV